MLCDVDAYFNSDNNACTNQKFIRRKDLLRGVTVKE